MIVTRRPEEAASHRANNLGLLRLLFAALVVVAHSPELIDGNRSREILTRVFGTVSFGEVAVDGFFLISGYLITRSYLGAVSPGAYLARRILRIYPGFLVASLVCVAVVAPLAGGVVTPAAWLKALGRMALLAPPDVPGAFAGLPYPLLNGSMWTISYEFGCYLLVLLLGILGVLRRPRVFLALLAGLCLLYALRGQIPALGFSDKAGFRLASMIRFAAVFCCGGAFYLWRHRIAYSGRGAALAAALLVPLLFSAPLAEPAFVVLGGYLVFWFAFAVPPGAASLAANRLDPSYGLYLYAWPIQNQLVLYAPGLSPWSVTLIALGLAGLFGIASWLVVEEPAMRRGLRPARPTVNPAP
ncbi:acyltransferase family protein [Methylobacterium oryzisoli]|uniref:acyltransferase family protein n=1 Tax=Methylobacterium oryzisoli TaxID=3385502 RepID=UPI003892BECF